MTRRYWIIIVLCILFNIACGFVPLATVAIPTNTDIAPAVTMDPLTNTLTPVLQNVTSTPKVSTGEVIADRLNLRERPDYLSPADGAGLVKGDVVVILATVGNWYLVKTSDGRTGYARAEYVK